MGITGTFFEAISALRDIPRGAGRAELSREVRAAVEKGAKVELWVESEVGASRRAATTFQALFFAKTHPYAF